MRTFLILDFDSTLVRVESLDELATIALRDDPDREQKVGEIRRITRLAMEGRIGFRESVSQRLALFRPEAGHLTALVTFLKQNVSATVSDHRDFIQSHAGDIYVVSGGFSDFILPITAMLGIPDHHVYANEFVRDEAGRIVGCDTANVMACDDGKVRLLNQLQLPGRVVMVGDGYSDYRTREAGASDYFVAYCEHVTRDSVTGMADQVAESFGDVIDFCYSVKA